MKRISILVCSIAVTCSNAFAQTAIPPAPAKEDPLVLSDFVVTAEADIGYRSTNSMSATKTNTPLNESPQSIQVINQEFILDQGALDLGSVIQYSSGITEGTDTRGDRFNLRGYVTGIPSKDSFRDSGRAPREMSNVERVELVKGPAAFAFGRTNPGGVINLVLKRPLTKRATTVTGIVGSNDLKRVVLDTTGPLDAGKKLAYRFIGAWDDEGSFRRDGFIKREFASPSFLWQVSPNTSFRLESEYLHDERSPNKGLVMLNGVVPDDIPLSESYSWKGSRLDTTQYNYMAEFLHRINEHFTVRLAHRYNNTDEFGYTTNVTAINATTQKVTRNVQRSNNIVIDNRYTQAELLGLFKGWGIEHRFLVGTELGWNNADSSISNSNFATTVDLYHPDTNLAPLGVWTITQDSNTHISYTSLYAQDQAYLFNRKVALILGGRHEYVDQVVDNFRTVPTSTTSLQQSFLDPRLGVAWMPSKALTVYALYTTSSVPVGTAQPDGTILKPTEGVSKEIGLKTSLFDERLTATWAAFQLNNKNQAIDDPARPGTGYQIAVGERQTRGTELDLTYLPFNNWTLLASLSYLEGKVVYDGTLAPGTPLNNNPKWTSSLWTRYDFKTGPLKRLSLGLGWLYFDSRYVNNTGTIQLPSYTRLDALIRYKVGKSTDLSVNLRNLADKRYLQASGSNLDVRPGIPFTIQATIRQRF